MWAVGSFNLARTMYKRSKHAKFQLLKIKNKKVMAKKTLIVENTNPNYTYIFEKNISPWKVVIGATGQTPPVALGETGGLRL